MPCLDFSPSSIDPLLVDFDMMLNCSTSGANARNYTIKNISTVDNYEVVQVHVNERTRIRLNIVNTKWGVCSLDNDTCKHLLAYLIILGKSEVVSLF